MSARNSYSMYGGGGGRTGSVRSSKRTTKEMNVRQEWSNSLNAGVSQPFSSMSQKPRVGAPPWTDRSPTGTTTEYLKRKMNQMVNPEQTNHKTRQPRQTRHRPSDEVLDPDAMVHQIFHLKKELLAQEIEKSRLVVDVRRLQQECSQVSWWMNVWSLPLSRRSWVRVVLSYSSYPGTTSRKYSDFGFKCKSCNTGSRRQLQHRIRPSCMAWPTQITFDQVYKFSDS
eukprot:m.153343 g.153343  ORF g.153343 m.153343 type:complete len:226 (+) comp30835_c0_seq23:168-845(+)